MKLVVLRLVVLRLVLRRVLRLACIEACLAFVLRQSYNSAHTGHGSITGPAVTPWSVIACNVSPPHVVCYYMYDNYALVITAAVVS